MPSENNSAEAWKTKIQAMTDKLKALIVDDSALIRRSLYQILTQYERIHSVNFAPDGTDAMYLTMRYKPDIVFLDLEMPEMNGFAFLTWLMKHHPVPTIIISSTDKKENIIKSYELGAIDFIPKPKIDLSQKNNLFNSIKDRLIAKIDFVSKLKINKNTIHGKSSIDPETKKIEINTINDLLASKRFELIFIGASTGGPGIIAEIVKTLKTPYPLPIIIGIHMPPHFTKTFAERLASISEINVYEAEENMPIENNSIIVSKGGFDISVKKEGFRVITKIEKSKSSKYTPSLDYLLSSCIDIYHDKVLNIILTGMGDDGLEGSRKNKSAGGITIAQKEDSCIVYGMPRVINENALAVMSLDIEEIVYMLNNINT